jgi:hypothetical protein
MARRKKGAAAAAVAVEDPVDIAVANEIAMPEMPPEEEGESADQPTGATPPMYAQCECGARLVLDHEKEAGVCEDCGHLGGDGKLYRTEEEAKTSPATGDWSTPADETTPPEAAAEPGTSETIASSAETTAPAPETKPAATATATQPSLFPPPDFDLDAAFTEICAKNRTVEARRREWESLKEETADAKKQYEAAAKAAEEAISLYDQRYREHLATVRRHEECEAAYLEKLEKEAAAKQTEPSASGAPTLTAEERVMVFDAPFGGLTPAQLEQQDTTRGGDTGPSAAVPGSPADSPTPLTDSLPKCRTCDNVLALDVEKATGQCESCTCVAADAPQPREQAESF